VTTPTANRFFENRNTCVGVRDDHVVESKKKGIKDCKIFEKIHESGATIVTTLMDVVNKLIDTDDVLVNQFDHDAKRDVGTFGTAGDLSSKLRKRPSEVLAVEGRQPSTFNIDEFNAALDNPCTFHEGALTRSVYARSSRGCSVLPTTPSDPEATATDPLHVATTTKAITTDVVTSSSRRTAATSATYLLRRRRATPTAPSSRPRGRST
jgi:hypothetical protein